MACIAAALRRMGLHALKSTTYCDTITLYYGDMPVFRGDKNE